ncbi:MAG: nicotinate phosphoribosyltransferase, partial [Bacteroidota bacterium]|nr:nicotinate phosphoribosyltransferase [Bacteroidota bacterium]
RTDSGDPIEFTNKALDFYRIHKIDPRTKTIVYSDALNLNMVRKIRKYVNGQIHDVYGIGTFLTNDVGVKPLNIVIKISHAKENPEKEYLPTIKLTDAKLKNTGNDQEIELCKRVLNIK